MGSKSAKILIFVIVALLAIGVASVFASMVGEFHLDFGDHDNSTNNTTDMDLNNDNSQNQQQQRKNPQPKNGSDDQVNNSRFF